MPQYILRFHNISMKFYNTCIHDSDSIHILSQWYCTSICFGQLYWF